MRGKDGMAIRHLPFSCPYSCAPTARLLERGDGVNVNHSSCGTDQSIRSEEHTSELQSLMRISYAVFCLKKKKTEKKIQITPNQYTHTTNDYIQSTRNQT